MARVIAIASDLLLGSTVEAVLTAAGHEVTVLPAIPPIPPTDLDLVVADLEVVEPEALVSLGVPVLGYYSHVNVEAKQAADDAGIDLAVPRSRMARELPALATKLLGG